MKSLKNIIKVVKINSPMRLRALPVIVLFFDTEKIVDICPNCATPLRVPTPYCANCGQKLDWSDAE